MDNLESQTYEAFEKDPVKYAQYEKAIVKALELETEGDVTVLMVSQLAVVLVVGWSNESERRCQGASVVDDCDC